MTGQYSPRQLYLAEYIPKSASLFAVFTGCLVFLGWMLDVPVLMSLIPGFATMKPVTAFAFILCGAALWFLTNPPQFLTTLLGQISAVGAVLIGLLTIAEYLFNWNLWIDYLFFMDQIIAEGTEFPGRLSPAAAINILLLGISLLCLKIETKTGVRPSQWLALLVALNALLTLIGYTYNVQALYKISYFVTLSLPSAIAFFVFSIGVLFANGNRGLTAVILRNSLGGVIVRRLLPAALVIPFVIGWATLKGEKANYYETGFGVAIFAMSNILIFTFLIWWAAQSLDQTNEERKFAQEALKNSEYRFRALIENSTDGIALIDKNNEILYLSPSVKAIEGYEPVELIGHNGVENTHPDDLPVIKEVVEELLKNPGKPMPVEWRRKHKDGHWLWLEGFGTNLLDDPAVGAIVTNYRDITNRKKAEEDLIKSEKRFRTTLDKMLEGVQIIDFDWKYVYINDSFTKQGKYSREELLGFTVMEKYPGIEQAEVYQAYQKCFNERVSIHLENKFTFPDNTTGWFELSFQPVPEGIFILSVDITERKNAEEELRSEKDRLEKMAMASPIAIFSFRRYPDGTVTLPYSSPKIYDVLGLTPEELKKDALPAFERVHAEDLPQVNDFIVESARDMTILHVVYRYQNPNKGEIWVECYGTPTTEDDGSVTWHGVANDVTERKSQEEKIRQLNENLEYKVVERTAELNVVNKELEAFSYSVSHDLRAPLRGIDGFSLALIEDYKDKLNDEGKYFLQRIRAGSQQMARLIDDMLKLSRVTRAEIVKNKVNLSEVVKTIARKLQENQPRDNVTFDIEENIYAIGDERLLRIALENLIENSYKFTSKSEDARIIFGQEQNGEETIYFVRDNGVGFDMAYADKLFGAFQRFHSVKDFEGTGIGLATVQRVINRHGGHIYAESKVGEGTSFYFTIK